MITQNIAPGPSSPTLLPYVSPPGVDKAAIERRILRKFDSRLVPLLFLLFLVSFVDRANIGNAKIQGMDVDLRLRGNDYNMAVMVFTLAYVLFGIPANILFKKTGPKSLSAMMLAWGVAVIGQGVTRSASGLIACRFLEGICEAGFVPGCAYLIGSYYKKDEFLKRYTVFFSAAILAGAFNGLFSTLISKMDGIGGYAGWRWIFIMEGLITIVFSFISIFIMVPFPEQSTLFTREEKAVVLARIDDDGGKVNDDKLDMKSFSRYMLDWKIWLAVITYFCAEENASSVVSFQPSILAGLGYTAVSAQVHSIPIYAASFAFSLLCAYLSERLRKRYVFGMLGSVLAIVGLAIELAEPQALSPRVRYMGMFFVTAGPYVTMPITVVWTAINVGQGYTRAVAFAAVIALGNCGAFVASNVFITAEAPVYRTGFAVNLAFACVALLSQTALYVGLRVENRRREHARALPASHDRDEKAYEDMSDNDPNFRYQL